MPPGAISDHLELFFEQLHTNATLQADFQANPANAVAPFQLTPHERDAVVTRDCDDFAALGLTNLPPLLGCPGGGGGGGRPSLEDILDALRARLADLFKWRPRPPDLGDPPFPPEPDPEPGPVPPPGPGPLPGPRPPGPRPPGPTPGPDPPDSDRPRPDRPRPDRPRPGGPGGPGGPDRPGPNG